MSSQTASLATALSTLLLAACGRDAASAPAGEGPLPAACAKSTLHESFASSDFTRRWDASAWPSPPLVSVDGRSALELDLASDPRQRSLALALGEPCHVVATAMMKVVRLGAGEIDLFEIVDDLGTNRAGVFLFGPKDGGLAVEGPQEQPRKVVSALGDWTSVRIEVDPARDQYAVTIGAESFAGSLHGTKTSYLSLGAPFLGAGATGWRVLFAELVVEKG